ncbi:MAG: YggS family pyridoxal phosphate-dependent enzyme [Acidobacteriota bacterium]|nr:YggS family pyridoxal phosphate-dependent enzyme [Blastocatellia bacterium]MDW8411382.1 YggS family pyridoxal phosphate-dependent enzyme [Acidobacteriota bacterium]
MSIKNNLEAIRQQINLKGRNVRLVAVTKTFPVETILEAIAAGITDIGENRVQEAATKFPHLPTSITKHLIGHLQSNKARKAVELFDWIHSVDSVALARKLDRLASDIGKTLVVLAQVDLAKEPTKSGASVEELPELAATLAASRSLDFRGLMTLPPFFEDPERTRPYFAKLRQLLAELNSTLPKPLTELSMGMSHDFSVAIEEGATIVRIGSAIFGHRH